jgi:predicted secreted protein
MWSGTMDIVYDDSTVAEVNAAISPDTDTVITGEFYPDASVVATKFAGTLIVTSFAVTASYDGLVTASVAFQGTGALSAATYSA